MTELERVFKIRGAYNGTSHPRNYGISAMRLFFAVKGPDGGVSATLSTSWYLPQNQESCLRHYSGGYPFAACEELMQPKWWDISTHAKKQQYEGQYHTENCNITNGECFGDSTALWGREQWLPGFLHGGSDWLFDRLEEYYRHVFEDGPAPDLTPVPRTFD